MNILIHKSNFTDDEINEYKEAFAMFDKNGDGLISKSELAVVLKSMGRTPTEKELQAMVNNRKKFHNSFL